MITPPSRGKSPHPAQESQITPGPLVEAPKFPQISIPDMGQAIKTKCKPGKFGGRVLRVGKK